MGHTQIGVRIGDLLRGGGSGEKQRGQPEEESAHFPLTESWPFN